MPFLAAIDLDLGGGDPQREKLIKLEKEGGVKIRLLNL